MGASWDLGRRQNRLLHDCGAPGHEPTRLGAGSPRSSEAGRDLRRAWPNHALVSASVLRARRKANGESMSRLAGNLVAVASVLAFACGRSGVQPVSGGTPDAATAPVLPTDAGSIGFPDAGDTGPGDAGSPGLGDAGSTAPGDAGTLGSGMAFTPIVGATAARQTSSLLASWVPRAPSGSHRPLSRRRRA